MKDLKTIARNAINVTIDVLDQSHALSVVGESTAVMSVRRKGDSVHKISSRTGLSGYELVHTNEQGVDYACTELTELLIARGLDKTEAAELSLQFVSHALDPVDPLTLNEDRFLSALKSMQSRIQGKERYEFLVPISNIKDTTSLWLSKQITINPPPLVGFDSIEVTLRKIRDDELTEWRHLRKSYHTYLLTEVFAIVFTFEFGEPDKVYPQLVPIMTQYVESFFNSLRLVKSAQIGSRTAMVMYNLDLPPVSILEYLDRTVYPRDSEIDLTPADVLHAEEVWNRIFELKDSKIMWTFRRYVRAASEDDDIDACIDLILALESLFGTSTYAVALRTSAAVNLGKLIQNDIFEFAKEVGGIRNNVFHGSSDPFKKTVKKYQKDEFIEKLRELTQRCILNCMWLDEAKGNDLQPLGSIIEQSVWTANSRKKLASKIPRWIKGMFKPPKRI